MVGLLAVGIAVCLPPVRELSNPVPGPDEVEAAPPALPRGPGDLLRRYPAGAVRLPADEAVLGVSVGGEHRAYVIRTLEGVDDHVAIDQLGGRPVAVSYCDRTGCGRAFAGAPGGTGLKVRAVGYARSGGMLLEADGRVYYQETGEPFTPGEGAGLPYADLPVTRTTWADWGRAHPDTTVSLYPTLRYGGWLSNFPAWLVNVPADAAVVGVTADGRSRAYLLEAFGDVTGYVVRDFLGDRPVAVTYCPETRQARVFVNDRPDTRDPPPLSFAGWRPDSGEMLLDLDGRLYGQISRQAVDGQPGELPYPELASGQTTWGEWKAAHPGTSLYVGKLRHYVLIPKGGKSGEPTPFERYRFALPVAAGLGLVVALLTGRRRPGSANL